VRRASEAGNRATLEGADSFECLLITGHRCGKHTESAKVETWRRHEMVYQIDDSIAIAQAYSIH
jgi:hypothetical protein